MDSFTSPEGFAEVVVRPLGSGLDHTGGEGTPLCDLNAGLRPDKVWFSGCFVLNGVSVSSLSVLNRVSLNELMAQTVIP